MVHKHVLHLGKEEHNSCVSCLCKHGLSAGFGMCVPPVGHCCKQPGWGCKLITRPTTNSGEQLGQWTACVRALVTIAKSDLSHALNIGVLQGSRMLLYQYG